MQFSTTIYYGLVGLGGVAATPFTERTTARLRRATDDAANGTRIQVWVPILVFTLIFAALLALMWAKRRLNRYSAAPTSAPEVTAEQLIGQLSEGNGAATTGRRPRRTRRTPSQISTRSLPAYMKEPGDHELVIIRGPQDMDDAQVTPTTVTVPMPVVNENDTDASSTNENNSEPSLGGARVSSAQDAPWGNEDAHNAENVSRTQADALLSPGVYDHRNRGSVATNSGSDESNSLYRAPSHAVPQEDVHEPRGEAPPYSAPNYFEVYPSESPTIPNATQDIPSPRSAPEPADRRRSGFRNFFHALTPSMHSRTASASVPPEDVGRSSSPGHSRINSSFSMTTSSSHYGQQTSSGRLQGHGRQSPSATVLTPFRTLTRPRSNVTVDPERMNSPSLISVNSISAPLTHTLMRSEFTYPKAGPTPEQLKLISSRDSIARFGVPYGPDAIAFAASNSRQDLSPPPDFEAVQFGGTPHVPSASGSLVGPSRRTELLTPSPALSHQRHGSSGSAASQPPSSFAPAHVPVVSAASEGTIAQRRASPTGTEQLSVEQQKALPRTPSPVPGVGVPPSSFRPPVSPTRAESRASTVASYATALEFMRSTDDEDGSSTRSTPATPRLAHFMDETGATVTYTAVAV